MDPKRDPSPEAEEAHEDIDLESEMAGLRAGGRKALIVALLVASGLFLLMTIFIVAFRDKAGPAGQKINVRVGGPPGVARPALPNPGTMTNPTTEPATLSPAPGTIPSSPAPRVFPTQQPGSIPVSTIPPEWRNDPNIKLVRGPGGLRPAPTESSPTP